MDIERLQKAIRSIAFDVYTDNINRREDEPWQHLEVRFNNGYGITASQTRSDAPFYHDSGPLGDEEEGTYELAVFTYTEDGEKEPCRSTEFTTGTSFRKREPISGHEVIEAAAGVSAISTGPHKKDVRYISATADEEAAKETLLNVLKRCRKNLRNGREMTTGLAPVEAKMLAQHAHPDFENEVRVNS